MISRRTFLVSLAGAGGILGAALASRAHARAATALVWRLVGWVAGAAEVHELGREYLVRHRSESVATLVAYLSDNLVSNPFRVTDARLRQAFLARVAGDFEQSRLTTLGGWVFSTTELKLSGLAYLRSDDPAPPSTIGVVADRAVTIAAVSSHGVGLGKGEAVLFEDSISVYLERGVDARSVAFMLDTDVSYRLSYHHREEEVVAFDVRRQSGDGSGFTSYRFEVPVGGPEFDQVRIVPHRASLSQRRGVGVRERARYTHRLRDMLIEEIG